MDIFIKKKYFENQHKRQAEFEEKEKRVFPVVFGQCSPSLGLQVEGIKSFEKICKENDVVELLKLIRGFCCQHVQNNDKIVAVLNSL